MYIAIAQNNPTTGALEQNAQSIIDTVGELAESAYPPDLVIFPAFALTGTPLDGLAFSTAFNAECLDQAQRVIQEAKLPCLFGSVMPHPMIPTGHFAEAEVVYCGGGQGGALGFSDIDEHYTTDYFPEYIRVKINQLIVAIFLNSFPDLDENDLDDCDLIIAMMAKEYRGTTTLLTSAQHVEELRRIARQARAWLVVVNLVGGQDDVVFDGGSLVLDPQGSIQASAPVFSDEVLTCNLTFGRRARAAAARSHDEAAEAGRSPDIPSRQPTRPLMPYEADWQAIQLATHDFVVKNGFSDVVIGLSGGIDSAATAALAVDALGPKQVHALWMPAAHSPESSRLDALELSQNLGIEMLYLPISDPQQAVEQVMQEMTGSPGSDLARQNLQARLRMVYLMHLSNTLGWLPLNTNNKSEAATGYSTLYGDSAGAFAPFGNIYKTDVYGLARWRNQQSAVIPESILNKPPSAELFAGQLDTDSLPPYDVLDHILRLHIEDGLGIDQIIDIIDNSPAGDPVAPELIADVLQRVSKSEFKRRQEPIAPNLGSVDITNFRSWPLTNGFQDRNRGLNEATDIERYLEMVQDWNRPEGWGFLAN
ncbi:MAG: NAD(+) synthase [Coriobacteriia bacterium]|nr:NAD(+) synthase [Coriobacteriia bacterium]